MKVIMLVDGRKLDVQLQDEYPHPHLHSGIYKSDEGYTIEIRRDYEIDGLREQIKAVGPRVAVMDEHRYLTLTMLRGIINASEPFGVSIIMSLFGDSITHQNAKALAHDILVTSPHD